MDSRSGFSRSTVRIVAVGSEHEGQRIDNFLANYLKGVPRSYLYRILRRGEVRVNKGRIRPAYRLCRGDQVRVPPLQVAVPNKKTVSLSARSLAWLKEAVLYEDDRLLALNKPSGLAVHGGSGISYGVIEALRQVRPGAPFLELVHRLDRDTSGCLLVAKQRSVLRYLHELLRQGRVSKTYLTLLRGSWQGGTFEVTAKLRKNLARSGERVVRVNPKGKQALTQFRPVKVFREASLMDIELLTGRTHQIRVHAAYIGHPVAGDVKYGDPAFNRHMRQLGLRRLFLHAADLAFELPGEGRPIELKAPLDPALGAVLEKLQDHLAC